MVAANQPTCRSSTSNEMVSEGQQFLVAANGTIGNSQVQFLTLPEGEGNVDVAKSFLLLPGTQQAIQLNGASLQVLQTGSGIPVVNVNNSFVVSGSGSVEVQPSTSATAPSYVFADTKDLDLSTVLQAFNPSSQFPSQCVLQVAHPTSSLVASSNTDEPLYVNAKQYKRIMRRREIRAKLEMEGKISKTRKKYLHESRHRHALTRVRGEGGKFDKGIGKDGSGKEGQEKVAEFSDQIRTVFRPAWMDRTLAPALLPPPAVPNDAPQKAVPKSEFQESQN